MKKTFTAWAVRQTYPAFRHENGIEPERQFFCGRYGFFDMGMPIPPHMEGCHISLFNTRALARKAAKEHEYKPYPRRVEKVRVTVESITEADSVGSKGVTNDCCRTTINFI
jgi:hypothetical protein